jgi:hypothetical protein
METAMKNTEPQRMKQRILGTTPPTDLEHRASLIHTALVTVYNHICMALPIQGVSMKAHIKSYWISSGRRKYLKKEYSMAKDRISASFNKGGLQVPHPSNTAEGLHLNLLQNMYNKVLLPQIPSFTPFLPNGENSPVCSLSNLLGTPRKVRA